MRVVKSGKIPEPVLPWAGKAITCEACSCVFVLGNDDAMNVIKASHGTGPFFRNNGMVWAHKCPTCRDWVCFAVVGNLLKVGHSEYEQVNYIVND